MPWRRFSRAEELLLGGGIPRETDLATESIKVLNWNIAKSNSGGLWQKDFSAILARHWPDLILLQEVRFRADSDLGHPLPGMGWNYVPNLLDAHHNAYSGILSAARSASVVSRPLLSDHQEPFSGTPKASLLTTYPLRDAEAQILVVNSHFINFVGLDKFDAQLREVEHHIARHRGPVLFSGDFNTWNRQRIELLFKVTDRLGLRSVVFAIDAGQEKRPRLSMTTLDHIFYRGLVEVGRGQVLDQVLSSDHKPMIVEFAFRQ